jgi:hypothetical protein
VSELIPQASSASFARLRHARSQTPLFRRQHCFSISGLGYGPPHAARALTAALDQDIADSRHRWQIKKKLFHQNSFRKIFERQFFEI